MGFSLEPGKHVGFETGARYNYPQSGTHEENDQCGGGPSPWATSCESLGRQSLCCLQAYLENRRILSDTLEGSPSSLDRAKSGSVFG